MQALPLAAQKAGMRQETITIVYYLESDMANGAGKAEWCNLGIVASVIGMG
jgi:hypothetical protein